MCTFKNLKKILKKTSGNPIKLKILQFLFKSFFKYNLIVCFGFSKSVLTLFLKTFLNYYKIKSFFLLQFRN